MYDVDNIFEFKVPEVLKYFTGGWFGYDKEGFPMWLDPFGKCDIKGILRSATKDECRKAKIQDIEEGFEHLCVEQSKKLNKRIDQIVVVYDMGDFGWKHLSWRPGVDAFLELVRMFEANYPETLRKIIVVNAPRLFPIAYNIVKPFMAEATVHKVAILGKNFKDTILEFIDTDQLPVSFGGTRTDPDGDIYCKSRVFQGGEVPEKFYKTIEQSELENLTPATVKSGTSLQVECEVTLPNSAIRWSFSTVGDDLGFGVYKRTKQGKQKVADMEEVIANRRVNCHMVPEDGTIGCKTTGIYIVRFDNSYSWLKNKKVYYDVEVLEPDIDYPNPSSSQTNIVSMGDGATEGDNTS
ncbi:hypothetical protein FSP39_014599 [Pinctada imbricata]|uniref:SEC14-like protein 2 n=1 Tax=Pinctada imbricata TaxID=66713 RepID=A0AA88XG76_PINIB|nr:hypothetical protein FSP39_014599 [Pinctada imbricata]